MAAFLKWRAGRYAQIQFDLPASIERLRKEAALAASHRHTPENIANLAVGLEYLLEFAVEAGAITAIDRDALWERGWSALCEAGCSQRFHQQVNDPSGQFLAYLGSAITSGKAYVAAVTGDAPPLPAAWGWRERGSIWESRGDLVGWVDGDDLYLDPEAAYRVVQIAVRDSNGSLALTESALWKRMKEKKLLASTDEKRETFKVRRKINGVVRGVLHLKADSIRPVADAEPDEDVGYPTTVPTPQPGDTEALKNEMSEMSVNLSNSGDLEQEELFG
jgi:hypothetical protein